MKAVLPPLWVCMFLLSRILLSEEAEGNKDHDLGAWNMLTKPSTGLDPKTALCLRHFLLDLRSQYLL
jgi:hypothetical protein